MPNTRYLAIALVAGALVLGACSSDDEAPLETAALERVKAAIVVNGLNTLAQRMLVAINKIRARRGLPPLVPDSRLARAAHGHASDMADNDFFNHKGSDGSSFAGRVTGQGYAYRFVGENIAAGLPSPQDTVESWLASPGHRRNVLTAKAIHAGIGYAFRLNDNGNADYGHYWVLTVGCTALAGQEGGQFDCNN